MEKQIIKLSLDKKAFSNKISMLRNNAGYTQEQVAEKLDFSIDMLKKLEQGTASPTAERLLQFAALYDVDIDYLVGRSDPKSKAQQTAANYTGLSEAAVSFLRSLDQRQQDALSALLVHEAEASAMLKDVATLSDSSERLQKITSTHFGHVINKIPHTRKEYTDTSQAQRFETTRNINFRVMASKKFDRLIETAFPEITF